MSVEVRETVRTISTINSSILRDLKKKQVNKRYD